MTNQNKEKVKAFLADMGFDPASVAGVEITPHVMWVHVYKRDNEGNLYQDDFGHVAKRTDKIVLSDFAEV